MLPSPPHLDNLQGALVVRLPANPSCKLALDCRRLLAASLILGCLTAAPLQAAESAAPGIPAVAAARHEAIAVTYKTVTVQGLNIFYREAGPSKAPAILLLHGFPSSSRMFDALMPLLADRYHLIAPDYPGFGNSEAPSPDKFKYTFDSIADIVGAFHRSRPPGSLRALSAKLWRPGRLQGRHCAPGAGHRADHPKCHCHEDGLGRLQAVRKGFWADRAANEARYRARLASIDTARLRHINGSPHPERYNPDLWNDEAAFLARPGEADIQSDLFYDFRNNLAAFPAWQNWLRERRPPTLIVWGRYDPVFDIAEVAALRKDLPRAEAHVLDAGHFALDESAGDISRLMRGFLGRLPHRAPKATDAHI
jgi:pimeloyl-ACP methyl ester carboxylesterase